MQAGADIVPTYILGQSQVINVLACLIQVVSHSVLIMPDTGCQSLSFDQAT